MSNSHSTHAQIIRDEKLALEQACVELGKREGTVAATEANLEQKSNSLVALQLELKSTKFSLEEVLSMLDCYAPELLALHAIGSSI